MWLLPSDITRQLNGVKRLFVHINFSYFCLLVNYSRKLAQETRTTFKKVLRGKTLIVFGSYIRDGLVLVGAMKCMTLIVITRFICIDFNS